MRKDLQCRSDIVTDPLSAGSCSVEESGAAGGLPGRHYCTFMIPFMTIQCPGNVQRNG